MPPIVLYDGTCGFCDATVRFFRDRCAADRLEFEPQRSPRGRWLLNQHGLDADRIASVVVIDGSRALTQTAAVLWLLRSVPGLRPLAYLGAALPPGLREAAYGWLARHRHRLFGKVDSCRMQGPMHGNSGVFALATSGPA